MTRRPKSPARRETRARVSEASPAYPELSAARLLLDSRVWVWWSTRDSRLGAVVRGAIADAHEVCVSAASAWELSIKERLGRLRIGRPVDLAAELARDGFVALHISVEHAVAAARLPPIHKDPFDRMLVAQAKIEGLTLVTADPAMLRYDVPLHSAR